VTWRLAACTLALSALTASTVLTLALCRAAHGNTEGDQQ
jgi:hypothetical protein